MTTTKDTSEQGEKQCGYCKKILEYKNFMDGKGKHGLRSVCIFCIVAGKKNLSDESLDKKQKLDANKRIEQIRIGNYTKELDQFPDNPINLPKRIKAEFDRNKFLGPEKITIDLVRMSDNLIIFLHSIELQKEEDSGWSAMEKIKDDIAKRFRIRESGSKNLQAFTRDSTTQGLIEKQTLSNKKSAISAGIASHFKLSEKGLKKLFGHFELGGKIKPYIPESMLLEIGRNNSLAIAIDHAMENDIVIQSPGQIRVMNGKRLWLLCEELFKTKKVKVGDLAKSLGLHSSSISGWRKAESAPTRHKDNIIKYAQKVGALEIKETEQAKEPELTEPLVMSTPPMEPTLEPTVPPKSKWVSEVDDILALMKGMHKAEENTLIQKNKAARALLKASQEESKYKYLRRELLIKQGDMKDFVQLKELNT